MSIINSQPLIGASGQGGGYTIAKSLRFRGSATAYLSRTPATTTNRQTWTWSAWVKRGTLGAVMPIFNANGSSPVGTQFGCVFTSADKIQFYTDNASTSNFVTTQVFRDPAAWYHLVFAFDTTQATSTNRVKLYVNGSQVTAFDTASYPAQNLNTAINTNTLHQIGKPFDAFYYDGYMTDVNFIDGQQLTPTSFGSFSGTGGVWQPIAYTGTYGTNGFYLKFADATSTSTLGNDSSGNGNTWTTNNISVTAGVTYDSMLDVPTLTSATAANYCVLNPLASSSAPTNGNLTCSGNAPQNWRSTIAFPNSGKFYAEFTCTNTSGSQRDGFGIQNINITSTGIGLDASSFAYAGALGQVFTNGSASISSLATWTNGDVVQIAVDCATGYVWFGKNNTWQASGNPSTGASPMITVTGISDYCIAVGTVASGSPWTVAGAINFGQRPFTYTPPTGFKALNTYNLPDSTIVAGNKVMDATLYTGTGSSLTVTNAGGFRPDLVWVKSRSAATDNKLTDSVRGVTKSLESNTTDAEATDTQGLTAFGTNGFTVGTNTDYNNLTATYVAWQWQAGQGTTSSNTSGSITSTVSVNASAGFSIVTWTGTGAVGTIGHGLGVIPSMICVKNRSASVTNWSVWFTGFASTEYLLLNLTDAKQTNGSTNIWNGTHSSSIINIGSSSQTNGSTNSLVAYCWAEVAGFSKFGSYTGNGSTDGPFVYTGFRPKFILFKRTDSTANWVLFDTARSTSNQVSKYLIANSGGAEGDDGTVSGSWQADFLSNGFKLRATGEATVNPSGGTIVYIAFAENPFKNALAR